MEKVENAKPGKRELKAICNQLFLNAIHDTMHIYVRFLWYHWHDPLLTKILSDADGVSLSYLDSPLKGYEQPPVM